MPNKKDERQGLRMQNTQGIYMTILKYNHAHDIVVGFDDGVIIQAEWKAFKNGNINNPNYPSKNAPLKNRLGEEKMNNQGHLMKIIQYYNTKNITVQFNNNSNHVVETSYRQFCQGSVRNPFVPTVYGIGITGNEYPLKANTKDKKEYLAWSAMLARCYSTNRKKDKSTYNNCTVCKEFLYYPNFYKWITSQENYINWKTHPHFVVDKDILCKGNTEYAPDKCCLVPHHINCLIKKSNGKKHKYMAGVQQDKNGRYVAHCVDYFTRKTLFLGSYNTENEAFATYKKYKESEIHKAAESEYANGMISKQCRDALLQYQIETS